MKLAASCVLVSCAVGGLAGFEGAAAAEFQPFVDVAPTGQPQGSAGFYFTTNAFRVRSYLAVRADGGRTYVAPQVVSSVEIAPKMSIETRFDFAEWNTNSALLDSAVEVKFRVRSELPLIDEIEGRVRRAPDGLQHNTLYLAVAEDIASSEAGRPVTFGARATFEQTGSEGMPALTSKGLQASLAGFGRTDVENRLAISYKAQSGTRGDRVGSISFGRSWPINAFTRLTVSCELIDAEAARSHNVGLSWRSEF